MVEPTIIPSGPRIRSWAKEHGFSDWLVARFARLPEAAGLDAHLTSTFLEGLQKRVPAYLRVNTLRSDPVEVDKRLAARGFRTQPTRFDPNVLLVQEAPISQGATMEHLMGMTSPQDLASSAAGQAMQARPGDVVCDLAAAPGMKTIHVAGDQQGRGVTVAVDPDAERVRALSANLERCGVRTGVIVTSRAQDVPSEAWADRVLIDAPCTGEGIIPKDRSRRRGEPGEVARLTVEQEGILDAADRILKPGGRLVYATCTFAPEENEVQVARLLARGYCMEKLPFDSCEGQPLGQGIIDWPGFEIPEEVRAARRFFPGIHPTLGFFVAALRKGDS